jgi:hypothetical protein
VSHLEKFARERGQRAMKQASASLDAHTSGFMRGMAFRWYALAEWCRLGGDEHRVFQ